MLAIFTLATGLAACGGGLSDMDKPSVPTANSALYTDLMSYCEMSEPTGAAATNDGWNTRLSYFMGGRSGYSGSGMVSPAGSSHDWSDPLKLTVPSSDYRGVSGRIVTSGYGKPEWRMGVAIPTVFSPKSVACVVQIARIHSTRDIIAVLAPDTKITVPGTPPTLIWKSFWNSQVPVSQLSGYQVDGFEFVSNFQPTEGIAYFVVDKAAHSTPHSMTICHLPAGGVQWACAPAGVTDLGENWQLAIQGVTPGAYVLVSPSLK